MNGWVTSLAVLALLGGAAGAQERLTQPLDQGWRFAQGEAPGAENPDFNDGAWAGIALPHSWNHLAGTALRGPDYDTARGAGWYRLSFTPRDAPGKRFWLQFDGASIITEVWLNGVKLGSHIGAFGRFRFDASAAIKPGQTNLLAVRTDNSSPANSGSPTAEIPPMAADFFMFGGLYRKVSLVAADPVHIDLMDDGGPGVYARTVSLDKDSADIEIVSRIANDDARAQGVKIRTTIFDDAGRIVAETRDAAEIAANTVAARRGVLKVAKPHLWNGKADPYLYRVAVSVEGHDRVAQPLGIRTTRLDPDKGFFLNGKHVALHGVSRHQDRPGEGWAISDADQREDMATILDLGANTLRLAHYQHDQTIYDLADRAGLAVWAEIPVVNRTAPFGTDDTTPGFMANAESQLRELIKQNFNHPSVIVWSIGNEVNLNARKGDGISHARPLLGDLHRLAKDLDPIRPTTLADCCEPWPEKDDKAVDVVAGITDAIGYNRYQGWYYDRPEDLGPVLDRLHKLHPAQPISVGEYGGGGALSQHSDDPMGGVVFAKGPFHPEEHQSALHEIWWTQLKARPYLWASWIWNMFDFASDSRNEGDMVDTNDKGLVSYDRKTRKDAFYYYQAQWSDRPVLHIAGRRYADRAYPVADVTVYSNAKSIRLSVNGKPAEPAACKDGVCRWGNLRLAEGDTTLAASAGKMTDSLVWHYGGRAETFRIRAGAASGLTLADGTKFGSDAFFRAGEAVDRHRSAKDPETPLPSTELVGGSALYDTYREGSFSYTIPVKPGRYDVTLQLFEPDDAQAGTRVFDVLANGRKTLEKLDPVTRAGGKMLPLKLNFAADADSDGVILDFRPVVGKAIVSTVEVVPVSVR